MTNTNFLTWINSAGRDDLIALPGLGPALADKLIAGRPFADRAALEAVRGISANSLEKLETAFADADISAAVDAEMPDADDESSSLRETLVQKTAAAKDAFSAGWQDVRESVSEGTQTARERVQAFPGRFEQTTQERGSLWAVGMSGLVSALLAVILTLGILASVNGGLKFVSNSDYRAFKADVAQLATQADLIEQDMDSLRTRVDTLEGLGDRTVALEKAQETLRSDMDSVNGDLQAMGEQISALQDELAAQEARTTRFETFLQNLQGLLNDLFTPEGAQ